MDEETTPVTSIIKYNSKQMDRALQKIQTRKNARQKARDEEKCYVEYRKQQVLSSFQPTVGALRSGDDAFPKRRRGSMDFGERKAHYLSIRPSARFATWVGRKKGVIEAKPQASPSAIQFTDHSTPPESGRSDSMRQERDKKSSDTTPQTAKVDKEGNVREGGTATTKTNIPVKDDGERGGKRGNKAENPLVNGQPFWIVQTGNETDEITDEDLPVDMDILERVCNGDLTLSQKPFQKTKFNPFGAMQRFKFDDALFDRDSTLFTSTVEAVISLQPDEDVQYPVHPPIQRLIKWSDKIQVVCYDPNDRDQPLEGPVVEELKDLRREKTDKK